MLVLPFIPLRKVVTTYHQKTPNKNFNGTTVDGRNPAPPGMYKTL